MEPVTENKLTSRLLRKEHSSGPRPGDPSKALAAAASHALARGGKLKRSSAALALPGPRGFRPPTVPRCGLLRCRQTWNVIFGIKSADEAVVTRCLSQRSGSRPSDPTAVPVSLASVLDSTHARHGHLADAGSKPQLKLEESAGDKNMETKSHPKTGCRGPRGAGSPPGRAADQHTRAGTATRRTGLTRCTPHSSFSFLHGIQSRRCLKAPGYSNVTNHGNR